MKGNFFNHRKGTFYKRMGTSSAACKLLSLYLHIKSFLKNEQENESAVIRINKFCEELFTVFC